MKKALPLFLLLLILLLAAFLRLYRISDYMTFLGDEGRDVLVAKDMLQGHFTLLGPRSSAGDFFMGPMYYYMITPFLALWGMDPVGPAIMVALFGVATVYLIYFIGKQFFNQKAGLFAAALYAVSPLVLTYSHSSWNPNVLPFFALLMMYLIFVAVGKKNPWKYYFAAGLLLGISMQLHYLSIFLAVVMVLYIFTADWMQQKKIQIVPLLKQYVFLFIGFLVTISPFLAFEVRHGFPNTRSIFTFILGDTLQKTATAHAPFFTIVVAVFFRVFARLLVDFPVSGNTPNQLWGFIAIMIAIASLIGLFYSKNKQVVLLLSLWLFLSILFFGFYKKAIYDYHFVILFPVPFLLVGNLLSQVTNFGAKDKKHIVSVGVSLLLFLGLLLFNLSDSPFKNTPNRQKDQTRQIAEFVIQQTQNKPYNFALISAGNSDHAYRYYLDILGHKPVTIENQIVDPNRKSVTDQLLVVCEDTSCKPLGYSLWEVAGFGRASIVKDWNVSVVKVYRLVHYSESTKK